MRGYSPSSPCSGCVCGQPARVKYLWVLLAGTALAAITEIVQNLPIINREGEFEDFLADFAGVLFGFPTVPVDRTEVESLECIEMRTRLACS